MNPSELPQGWFSDEDINVYRQMYAQVPIGGQTAEIGVYRGRSLASVADIIRERNLRVWAVDTFNEYVGDKDDIYSGFMAACKRFEIQDRVTVVASESAVASSMLENHSLDLVFIDGDHSQDAVNADIGTWEPKVREDGRIAGHDYVSEGGVKAAVDARYLARLEANGQIWVARPGIDLARPRYVQLLIGLPSYEPFIAGWLPLLHVNQSRRLLGFHCRPIVGSALTLMFNIAWCDALNASERGEVTHFLMVHSDIVPHGIDWLDRLIVEMERTEADVMVAHSPIKDTRGLTSTALQTDDPWRPQRLTLKQIRELPETFTCDRLLTNTGLMLVDLRRPWPDDLFFDIRNGIMRNENNLRVPLFQSEDWLFAQWAREHGKRVYATRAVTLDHIGGNVFASNGHWGADVDELSMFKGELLVTDSAGQITRFNPSS